MKTVLLAALTSVALFTSGAALADTLLRVNQLGYLPDGPKRASLITDRPTPVLWQLVDAKGREIARGQTKPLGMDASVGRKVHLIDFSEVRESGEKLSLVAERVTSPPFAIEPKLYVNLPRDAFGYFYPMRSGIEIRADIAGEAYARPAGHVSAPKSGALNQGDKAVPCQEEGSSLKIYGDPWSCDYTLDVTGGWYDAGDQGKYVVNGALSVAQLMSTFERTLYVKSASAKPFADGALALPEHGNGVPDALDEARWELEFLLSMQVPEGKPLAGMAHHKVHDDEWTGIPTLPHEDPKRRLLHRPSTAATLNLAAAAAQGARLFKPYDAAFAERLLKAAQQAWRAAAEHPGLIAPEGDSDGGGAYHDTDLTDELYWAAAELFITTGNADYRAAIEASPHWRSSIFKPAGYEWANVETRAALSLALVPNSLSRSDAEWLKRDIVTAADEYLKLQKRAPFGHVYDPPEGRYAWGSNHLILQNAIIIARAHDLTGSPKYRDAVLETMDYIFGRNGPGISYVTGYGTDYVKNQHSRWFAHAADPALPSPPKGTLAGGPNVWLSDEIVQEKRRGCAPQFCYIDDIESWSTNETAINWNAALAELSGFLAEQ